MKEVVISHVKNFPIRSAEGHDQYYFVALLQMLG